jgi:anthranilate phosphoribosyltransferase
MIQEAIRLVAEGETLTRDSAAAAMRQIMEGEATPAQIAALLMGLRVRGETVDELTGFATVMRDKCLRIHPRQANLVDTCGTGGDKVKTFNISTIAAFVAAGAGVAVAKHGNRSITSRCGSADLLEALGVNLAPPPEVVQACIDEIGIGFLFALAFHPAMKYAAPVRREMSIRTVFNLLGPLTNPAGARAQVLGVFSAEWTEPLAQVLCNLGAERAFVVHGMEGLDELSTVGESRVAEVREGRVAAFTLRPQDVGLEPARPEDLAGSDAAASAQTALAILGGEPGPRRDIVLLNAAAAIVAGGRAEDLGQGIAAAAESLDSGAALEKLERLKMGTGEA